MEENKVEDKTEKTFKERYLAGEIEFERDRSLYQPLEQQR